MSMLPSWKRVVLCNRSGLMKWNIGGCGTQPASRGDQFSGRVKENDVVRSAYTSAYSYNQWHHDQG
jgi:hypothetical protein